MNTRRGKNESDYSPLFHESPSSPPWFSPHRPHTKPPSVMHRCRRGFCISVCAHPTPTASFTHLRKVEWLAPACPAVLGDLRCSCLFPANIRWFLRRRFCKVSFRDCKISSQDCWHSEKPEKALGTDRESHDPPRNEWMDGWMSGSTNDWMSGWMNKNTKYQWLNQWMYSAVHGNRNGLAT